MLLVIALAIPILFLGLMFVPVWPCPSCVDLDIFILGCDVCGGSPVDPQFITLWKRWEAIQEIGAYRSPMADSIPLFP